MDKALHRISILGSSKALDLSYLDLDELPELPTNLLYLDCSYNKLAVLPILPSNLKFLACSHNKLINLNNIPFSLKALHCEYNQIKDLPLLSENLSILHCRMNLFEEPYKTLCQDYNLSKNSINKIIQYYKRKLGRDLCNLHIISNKLPEDVLGHIGSYLTGIEHKSIKDQLNILKK